MGMTIDEWYSGKREKRPLVKGPLWCNASDASESSSDEHERARQEERQEDVGNKEDAARGEETSVEETSHRLDKTGRTDRVERRGATHSESGRAMARWWRRRNLRVDNRVFYRICPKLTPMRDTLPDRFLRVSRASR